MTRSLSGVHLWIIAALAASSSLVLSGQAVASSLPGSDPEGIHTAQTTLAPAEGARAPSTPAPSTPAASTSALSTQAWSVESLTLKNGLRARLEPTSGGAEVAVCTTFGVPLSKPFSSEPDYADVLAKQLASGGARGQKPADELVSERGGHTVVRVEPKAVSYCTVVPARELPFALWLAESRFLPLRKAAPSLDAAAREAGSEVPSDAALSSEIQPGRGAPAIVEAKLRKLVYLGRYRTSEGNLGEVPTTDELTQFHTNYYVANNAAIALSGGFEVEKAKQLLDDYLGHVARGVEPPSSPEGTEPQTTQRFSVAFDSEAKTPIAAYGWALPAGKHGDEARIALAVLSSPSRLGRRLKAPGGPASEVESYFDVASPLGLGFLYVVGRYASAPELIEREVGRAILELATTGPTRDELEVARSRLQTLRSDLVRTPAGRAELLSRAGLLGDQALQLSAFEDPGSEPGIDSLRPEQVRLAASELLVAARRATLEYYPKGWKDPWETPMRVYHIVSAGQSLSSIAKEHNTTVAVIVSMNKLNQKSPIYPGDKLRVPRGKPKPKLRVHTLKRGETLSHLAVQYGVSVKALTDQNGLGAKQRLRVGQTLEIPSGAAKTKESNDAPSAPTEGRSHTVRSGETLSGIAHHYGLGTDELAKENGLGPRALVRVGQKLRIPSAKSPASDGPTPTLPALKGQAPNGKGSPPKGGTETKPPLSAPKTKSYTVKKGDTLIGIAQKHGVKVDELIRLNSLSRKKPLQLGQKLLIPPDKTP